MDAEQIEALARVLRWIGYRLAELAFSITPSDRTIREDVSNPECTLFAPAFSILPSDRTILTWLSGDRSERLPKGYRRWPVPRPADERQRLYQVVKARLLGERLGWSNEELAAQVAAEITGWAGDLVC